MKSMNWDVLLQNYIWTANNIQFNCKYSRSNRVSCACVCGPTVTAVNHWPVGIKYSRSNRVSCACVCGPTVTAVNHWPVGIRSVTYRWTVTDLKSVNDISLTSTFTLQTCYTGPLVVRWVTNGIPIDSCYLGRIIYTKLRDFSVPMH